MARAAKSARPRVSGPAVVGTALAEYDRKRDFTLTPEPPASAGAAPRRGPAPIFVVHKHAARSAHYDLRLEAEGVLWSWAVPKGPSADPADKRMAVRTEDHPLAYADFSGRIPAGQYGAGQVEIWDHGTWVPAGNPVHGLQHGKLAFQLHGSRLHGAWELVRLKPREGDRQAAWLLFKKKEVALPVLAPQLASLSAVDAEALARLDPATWLLEQKFDGYRMLARLHQGQARLFTRNGHDWTGKLPALAAAIEALPAGTAWFDGEVVVEDPHGHSDFERLQSALDAGVQPTPLTYWLFDLPHFDGHDLRAQALTQRRALLKELLTHGSGLSTPLKFSEELGGSASVAFAQACKSGEEGLLAKRRDAAYSSGRSSSWLKLKCRRRQEFVIGGFSLRNGSTAEIGSLMLGVFDDQGSLHHVGGVGAGWSLASARSLLKTLAASQRNTSPFGKSTGAGRVRWQMACPGHEQWVEPKHVAEVSFADWTSAGRLRHATFVGLREDKPAAQVRRERDVEAPVDVGSAAFARAERMVVAGRAANPVITHGERLVDRSTGTTKAELTQYFDAVAEWVLPELNGRPVTLLRAPQGVDGPHFFQKSLQGTLPPGMQALVARSGPGPGPGPARLLEITDRRGLLAAAQMNVIELHTGNAGSATIDSPERVVFDLDPGQGVGWDEVREAAVLLRALLNELNLRSAVKTSGGKGLHVIVPTAPLPSQDGARTFSKAVVQHLARTVPARFVSRPGPANRLGRIFVDYLRNSRGATTVTAFSPRARPGLGVSMTIDWDDLPALTSSAHWSVANAAHHLATRSADPWLWLRRQPQPRQALNQALRRLREAA